MTENYDKVSLLLPMNGANNGTVFPDFSPVPKTVTAAVGIITSTAQSKYYGSSLYVPASANSALQLPNTFGHLFGSSDWYIGAWIYVPTLSDGTRHVVWQRESAIQQHAISFGVLSTGSPFLQLGGTTGNSSNNGGASLTSGAESFSQGAWAHIAAARSGNTVRVFANGVVSESAAFSISVFESTQSVNIGSDGGTRREHYVNDLEIQIGGTVPSANFTPPTRRIGTISNADAGSDKIRDINGDPAERTVFAVPRSAPVRMWSTVSNASGEFEIQAPAGVDHSVVALADEATLYNDIVHRVIPE